jgi:Flp pilus assembly protein TadG
MWDRLRTRPARCTKRSRGPRRRGAALAEFSVCLPILIIVVLGSIEATRLLHVQHGLTTAAYEAARTASARNRISSGDVDALVSSVLNSYQVTGTTVQCSPADLGTVQVGQSLTITVTVPVQDNRVITGWLPQWLLPAGNLSARCTVIRG